MSGWFRSGLSRNPGWGWICPRFESFLERGALVLLLAVEWWLFSGSFHKFFTHDSLFYMIHAPQSWGQLARYFLEPGEEKNFRPVNMAVVAALKPLLGLDFHKYHWIPPAFHAANTLLFYFLARRILSGRWMAFVAAAFWGLHSVAGWVTYDITYLSDFLLAFLLLGSLLLALEAWRRRSPLLTESLSSAWSDLKAVEAWHRKSLWLGAGSLLLFVLALLTKESAVTFPLALWVVLSLAEWRESGRPADRLSIYRACRKTLGVTCVYAVPAVAFAALFFYWQRTGMLYTQSANAAYSISPWSNPGGKLAYFYWALNLPDLLRVPKADKIRLLIMAGMGAVLLVWAADLYRRRFRLSFLEWSGIAWFLGLNLPSFLLSRRLGKWYLYIPLFGLALVFAALAENLSRRIPRPFLRAGRLALAGLLLWPVAYSTLWQTRSYVLSSDCSFQSDVLQDCLRDFQKEHPALPGKVHLFFLPAFDEGISHLLSVPPIGQGKFFELFYPGTRFTASFAHKGDRLPDDTAMRKDWIVLQYLDRHLYDVTRFMEGGGPMNLFLLPTSEGTGAPLLKKEPAGGWKRFRPYVRLQIGDEGGSPSEESFDRGNTWVLQYRDGRFDDVTQWYGNPVKPTVLLLPGIDGKVPSIRSMADNPELRAFLGKNRLRFLSSGELARLPKEFFQRADVTVFQELSGHFYNVTAQFRSSGKMTLFLLPTFEGQVPLPVQRDAACRNRVCGSPVDLLYADRGAALPDQYALRGDLWILQYMAGSFSDVTDYYQGRRQNRDRNLLARLEGLQCSVDRAEGYPDYERFSTPSGAPVFFPMPGNEIVTQIGGTTCVVALGPLGEADHLRFDVSWMHALGDGAWAEVLLRTGTQEKVLFREYMHPDPSRRSLLWKEVHVDLSPFAPEKADLILRCYNDAGKNTVGDWLNWRKVVLEGLPGRMPEEEPQPSRDIARVPTR